MHRPVSRCAPSFVGGDNRVTDAARACCSVEGAVDTAQRLSCVGVQGATRRTSSHGQSISAPSRSITRYCSRAMQRRRRCSTKHALVLIQGSRRLRSCWRTFHSRRHWRATRRRFLWPRGNVSPPEGVVNGNKPTIGILCYRNGICPSSTAPDFLSSWCLTWGDV